jgi:hypothetical protein
MEMGIIEAENPSQEMACTVPVVAAEWLDESEIVTRTENMPGQV